MPSILGVWETGRLLLWEGFVIGRFAAILGFGPPLGFRALADLSRIRGGKQGGARHSRPSFPTQLGAKMDEALSLVPRMGTGTLGLFFPSFLSIQTAE